MGPPGGIDTGVTESSVSGEGAMSICEGGKEMDEEDKAFQEKHKKELRIKVFPGH